MENKLNYKIWLFRDFLNNSWVTFDKIMESSDWDNDPYFIDDWLQANWELLVERQCLGENFFLSSYGSCGSKNKRIINSNSKATHRVMVKSKNTGALIDETTLELISDELEFCQFLSKRNDSFGVYSPFDLVECKSLFSRDVFVVKFSDIIFELSHVYAQ